MHSSSLLTLAVLAAVLASACATLASEALFEEFRLRFGRTYAVGSQEYTRRLAYFQNNLERAQRFNATAESRRQGHTAVFGITKFSDYGPEELSMLRGVRPQAQLAASTANTCTTPVNCTLSGNISVPDNFDWRNDSRNVITPVRDQGKCGSCWAFGSVETLEAAWVLAGNPRIANGQASIQQLMSCDTQESGCFGGDISLSMSYLVELSKQGLGLESNTILPYGCADGCPKLPQCPAKLTGPFFQLNSSCSCRSWNEAAMKVYLAKYGTLTIMVDADIWTSYMSGILRYHCSSLLSSGDHAVQLVGYGEENVDGYNVPYWIVRNSWGTNFGENGYIRLYRGANVCGVVNDVNFGFSNHPNATEIRSL